MSAAEDDARALAALRRAVPSRAAAVGAVWTLDELDGSLPVASDAAYAVRARTSELLGDEPGADGGGSGTAVSVHFTNGAVRLAAARLPGDFVGSVLVSARSRHADWLTPASLRPAAADSDWWVYESAETDEHRGEMSLITVSGGAPLELLFLGLPNVPRGTVVSAAAPQPAPADSSSSASGDDDGF